MQQKTSLISAERALSWHTRSSFMLTNLACPINNLSGEWDYTTVQRLHHRQTWSHATEGWKDASKNTKWIIVQCATFSKSLKPRNIDKNVSDIRIRFPLESNTNDILQTFSITVIETLAMCHLYHFLRPWFSFIRLFSTSAFHVPLEISFWISGSGCKLTIVTFRSAF